MPRVRTAPEASPTAELLTPESVRGWGVSIALHILLLLVLAFWVYTIRSTPPPTLEAALAGGSPFGTDTGEGFEGAGDRARNIRPAADRVFTGGLSWWPVYWVRFMGNVVVERYLDALLAPEPGKQGNYVTLLFRAQLALP